MLLETLDIKKNDIIIFSHNIFDLEENFKIIFKDDPQKKPHKITYGEVCSYVNEYTPKNMIVYRLLTNIKDFKINLSKYGFFININNLSELIYFDPIYAVKELEEYSEAIDLYNLRFRIQQVGLTTLNRKRELPNFAEIYSIDLEAIEAKHQNDSVFVEAIYAVDRTKKKQIKEPEELPKPEPEIEPVSKKGEVIHKVTADNQTVHPLLIEKEKIRDEAGEQKKKVIKIIRHQISEDKDFDFNQVLKINYRGKTFEDQTPKPESISDIQPQKKYSFKQILRTKAAAAEVGKPADEEVFVKPVQLIEIFKSPESLEKLIAGREEKKIVLKLLQK
jgi:hypothetical protein